MTSKLPLDPQLVPFLERAPWLSRSVLPEHIPQLRQAALAMRLSDQQLRCDGRVTYEEIDIPLWGSGAHGRLLVLSETAGAGSSPGVCFFHGGGMVSGNERTGLEAVLEWVLELRVSVLSVNYRLAPEYPAPISLEDCYAALCWVDANRPRLRLDASPLIVAGASAGGGLAAGAALLARSRGGPSISHQILMAPMLDDEARFPSSRELDGNSLWDARSNQTGWDACLGTPRAAGEWSATVAPSRETRLDGLPAAYIDVGAVETFRDEAIDYAARLARARVPTELHVWSGAFHGFDVLVPSSAVARAARTARLDYLRRQLPGRERT